MFNIIKLLWLSLTISVTQIFIRTNLQSTAVKLQINDPLDRNLPPTLKMLPRSNVQIFTKR